MPASKTPSPPSLRRSGRYDWPDGRTRIKPPADVIKLADRLEYVLQPSLESLLAESSLCVSDAALFRFNSRASRSSIPVRRRSWPTRWAWARRCRPSPPSGYCSIAARRERPAGLSEAVSDELAAGVCRRAPETPVMVVEGDQAKRQWLWRLPDVPLRIANYELLLRDRESARWAAFRPGRAR